MPPHTIAADPANEAAIPIKRLSSESVLFGEATAINGINTQPTATLAPAVSARA